MHRNAPQNVHFSYVCNCMYSYVMFEPGRMVAAQAWLQVVRDSQAGCR